jgi:uncharacterized membrane protein
MSMTELTFILKWWLVIFAIGISFLPLTTKLFSSFKDKGYAFSKIIGILFISYAVFILGSLKILKFTEINTFIIWIIISVPLIFIFKKSIPRDKKTISLFLVEEVIFFASLFIWSYIRGFSPDIHDLEKFMDFGFINSILRSEYFPPRDMWFTPLSINYYYFGHLFTAVLTKLSQIPSYITFNLMLASIFAFSFTFTFSIGINLLHNFKKYSLKINFILGLLFAYVLSLAGNLQTIYAFFQQYNSEYPLPLWKLALSISSFPNAYWYPSATRFIYHTIHEFPSYSFVVADLHGHVLDIPIVLLMIAVLLVLFMNKKISYPIVVLQSFLIAIAYMTNAWDGIIYLALTCVFIFNIAFINLGDGKFKNRALEFTLNIIKSTVVLFSMFYIFTFIFNKNFSPFASGIGLNCSPGLLIKIQKIGPIIFEKDYCQVTPFWQLLVLYGFFLFMLISFLIFIRKRKKNISDYFVLIISLFSVLLIIAPEIIYLKDIYTGHFRANTMFKLSYQAFIMFSISSVYILIRIISEIRYDFKKITSRIFYITFIIGSFILLFFVTIYPYFSVRSGYANLNNRKSLDGIKYLNTIKPEDYNAINWINQNIKSQPVILEAQGDSYTDFARISANTGLPTVLGWTVHEWLWRGSYDIPASRLDDILKLYESKDLRQTKKIIEKYDISYIYIGGLEKEKYKVFENKFSKLGKLVYSKNGTKIYKIN